MHADHIQIVRTDTCKKKGEAIYLLLMYRAGILTTKLVFIIRVLVLTRLEGNPCMFSFSNIQTMMRQGMGQAKWVQFQSCQCMVYVHGSLPLYSSQFKITLLHIICAHCMGPTIQVVFAHLILLAGISQMANLGIGHTLAHSCQIDA